MQDVILAIAHHVIVFSIFGLIAAELVATRLGMDAAATARVARLDAAYGALALLILFVGFGRAVFAEKQWAYYSSNLFFWLKIATFAAIGILSIGPTRAFLRWRRSGEAPPAEEIVAVRRALWLEIALFVPLLAFAAAMARGYGIN